MSLKERVYSVLVISAKENFNASLQSLLPESKYAPVQMVSSVSLAKRVLLERSFDFVFINTPLPDDFGTRFAMKFKVCATICLEAGFGNVRMPYSVTLSQTSS